MEYNENKEFLIQFILETIGRDIYTTASKTYKKFQNVKASDLFEFAKANSLIFQLEESSIKLTKGALERIHILDDKNRTHILALETLKGY